MTTVPATRRRNTDDCYSVVPAPGRMSSPLTTIAGVVERFVPQTRQDMGPVAGRFTSLEIAVVAGDELATRYRVRLYFLESPRAATAPVERCRR
jgi:hypothetical protein